MGRSKLHCILHVIVVLQLGKEPLPKVLAFTKVERRLARKKRVHQAANRSLGAEDIDARNGGNSVPISCTVKRYWVPVMPAKIVFSFIPTVP